MGMMTEIQESVVWDQESFSLVKRFQVYMQIVGNQGTVFYEEGPLFCVDRADIDEACAILIERLRRTSFDHLSHFENYSKHSINDDRRII